MASRPHASPPACRIGAWPGTRSTSSNGRNARSIVSAIQTTSIDISELREMLEHLEPVVLLDIRPTADWEDWNIPGSRHVDAYQALKAGDEAALANIELDPSTPVVTLCGVGKVSQLAAEQLRARGIDARSLAGGM